MGDNLKKTIGLLLIIAAAAVFCFGVGSLNRAQSLGGVMSGAPTVAESISLAAVFVFCAALLWFGGIWLTGLSKKSVGLTLIAAGFVCSGIVALNYFNAPPADANETDKIPVNNILHLIAFGISVIVLLSGIGLSLRKNLE